MKPTTLLRWNPLKEMEEMQSRMASLFGPEPMQFITPALDEKLTTSDWIPSVDITEDEKEYLFKVDLPEMRKEDEFSRKAH